jgi:Ca2+-binding EF-hand superfamily protein
MASQWKRWFPAGYANPTPLSRFERHESAPCPALTGIFGVTTLTEREDPNQSGTNRGSRRNSAAFNRIRKGHTMISRRTSIIALAAGTLLATGLPISANAAHSSLISLLDKDNDGTVDLAEAKAAASALFDRLERDKDGTLDKRELSRRLSAKELAAADPDHDGTLSKEEYLALVEQRFNAADPDHDGTLDAKELNSPAGKALLRLLK